MGNTENTFPRKVQYSIIPNHLFHKKPRQKLLMVSLDAAGKTTLLYQLVLGSSIMTVIPTIGFNVENMEFQKNELQFWDVGGGWAIRQLWPHYLQGLKGIIFVVDLNDEQRMDQALNVMMNLLSHYNSKDKFLFVFGNKKDLAQPRMIQVLSNKVKQLKITQKYRLKVISSFDRKEVIEAFQEISEIFAIVK